MAEKKRKKTHSKASEMDHGKKQNMILFVAPKSNLSLSFSIL
jgi:hypothetical protein